MERRNGALANAYIPSKGERIELSKSTTGVHARGTVFYADQLQILVKFDDGRSQSLRVGGEAYHIIEEPRAPASARSN
jgi:hypothetical protein